MEPLWYKLYSLRNKNTKHKYYKSNKLILRNLLLLKLIYCLPLRAPTHKHNMSLLLYKQ